MPNSKYKIRVIQGHFEDGYVRFNHDLKQSDFWIVTFPMLCFRKGIKPKLGFTRRVFKATQKDRINTNYPANWLVAALFCLESMPDKDADIQPSSIETTKTYIKLMYGESYAANY